jgi:hypothetical protein
MNEKKKVTVVGFIMFQLLVAYELSGNYCGDFWAPNIRDRGVSGNFV